MKNEVDLQHGLQPLMNHAYRRTANADECWPRVTDCIVKLTLSNGKSSNNTWNKLVASCNNEIVVREFDLILHVHQN